MKTKKDKYAVGTAETGTICHWPTLKEARDEAKDWAASEPGVSVIIFGLNEKGDIADTFEVHLVENEKQSS